MKDDFKDTLKEYISAFFNTRTLPLMVVYLLLFAILVDRMFYLQIVKGEEYSKVSASKKTYTRPIKAARGNIYDCNGVLLASNKLSHTVTFRQTEETKAMSSQAKNEMIYQLVKLIEKNGGSISAEFYIEINDSGNFEYTISGNSLLRFKKEIYSLGRVEELNQKQRDMSAKDMYEYLRYSEDPDGPRFLIDKKYDDVSALKIMTVRFAMFMNRYQNYQNVVIAKDVDDKTAAAVLENSTELPGVSITEDTARVYADSKYFAHVLGYTGAVSSERLEKMQEEDPETPYTTDDHMGISGVESSFEGYLRGVKGKEKLRINETNGQILETLSKKEPVAGNDIYLTIDAELQKECYNLLEEHIAGILVSKISKGSDAGTKGVSASGIKIPIFDVYNALIENNVIDVSRFTDDDASALEKSTYKMYEKQQKKIIAKMKKYLSADSTITSKKLSKSYEGFLDYFYTYLEDNNIIVSSGIDTSDSIYKKYVNGKISLSKYLQHIISENLVDLSVLNIGSSYYSTEEIYNKLVEYAFTGLQEDEKFIKMVYGYLIYHFDLSGEDICLLLFDQGDIEYNAKEYRKLKTYMTSPYSFLIKKIKHLEITPGQLGLEPCSGSLVVTDPNTGDVKAMVSYPSYDNNMMANQVDSEYFFKYLSDNNSSPLLDRPTQQELAPGSTFKIVSSITALEEGIITTTDTIFDRTKFTKIVPSPKCWSSSSHGNINVTGAIEVSCNYFFYEVGYRLSGKKRGQVNNVKGLKRLKKYADMFGLTDKSGVEITESSPKFSDSDAVRSAIGQGTHSYAPVQLARYVSTVANSGTCYNMTLLDCVKDKNGNVLVENSAGIRNTADIKQSTWNAVHSGMYKVANSSKSSISSMFSGLKKKVAGKTGTAQQNTSHPNHSYFISYAPYNKPEITVTCVIPNGFTSANAAQTARDVYKYYFSKGKKKVSGGVKMPESNEVHSD